MSSTAASTNTSNKKMGNKNNNNNNTSTAAAAASAASAPDGGATPKTDGTNQKPIIRFGPFEVTNQVFLQTQHSFALVNLKPLLPGHVLVCPLRPHRRLTDLTPAEVTDLFVAVQRVQRMLARYYFSGQHANGESDVSPDETTTTTTAEPVRGEGDIERLGSFNIAVQDGPEAGQTVSHVHVHVIPRIRGSTAKPAETPSDELYHGMANEDGNVGGALWDRREMERRRQTEAEAEEDERMQVERPQPGGSFPQIEDADRKPRAMDEMETEAALYRRVLEEMDLENGEGSGSR